MLPTVNARIYPRGGLDVLSRDGSRAPARCLHGGMHDLLRRCALAVLTSGSASDDPRAAQRAAIPTSTSRCCSRTAASRIDLHNAPAMAFVDGEIIRGVAELLFAVVRDLAYTAIELDRSGDDLDTVRRHHRRRVRPAAQRARAAADRSQPGRVLGRPFDRPRRIRLHQAGRLRARPARPGHLHRLRPGRDEGPDEGRDHRPRQAAPPHAPATSASPSRASSRPNRRTRSSTTW